MAYLVNVGVQCRPGEMQITEPFLPDEHLLDLGCSRIILDVRGLAVMPCTDSGEHCSIAVRIPGMQSERLAGKGSARQRRSKGQSISNAIATQKIYEFFVLQTPASPSYILEVEITVQLGADC